MAMRLFTVRENFKPAASDLEYRHPYDGSMAVVSAIITDAQNRILIQDHVKTGCFTIPAGKIEGGETVLQALRRELREEIDCTNYTYSYVCHAIRDLNGNHFEEFIFTVKLGIGEVPYNMEPRKHKFQGYHSIKEILTLSYDYNQKLSENLNTAIKYLAAKEIVNPLSKLGRK